MSYSKFQTRQTCIPLPHIIHTYTLLVFIHLQLNCFQKKRVAVSMETTEPLSVGSFSFKWVINLKPSSDGLGDDSFRVTDEAATCFLELEPSRVPSWRFPDFNFPSSQTPSMLVHADDLFSNGQLMPFLLPSSKENISDASNSVPRAPTNCTPRSSFLQRCLRSWRKIIKKRLSFRKHSSPKVQDSSFSVRADTVDDPCLQIDVTGTKCEETFQQTSTDYFIRDWSDIEKSIQDAVLHCRRSYEK